jgi:hypothetical protein
MMYRNAVGGPRERTLRSFFTPKLQKKQGGQNPEGRESVTRFFFEFVS